MATQVAVLIAAKQAENVQTTQYTSTGVKTIIDKFTGTNTSAAAATLSINLIPSAGVAGNGNLIVKTKSLLPGETYIFPEIVGQVLDVNGFISTIAGAAGAITITAHGRQVA